MKDHCLKCNKYKEVNSFGYCDKCYDKVFKTGKRTTANQRKFLHNIKLLIIIIVLIIVFIFAYIYRNNIVNVANSLFNSLNNSSDNDNEERSSFNLFNSLENTELTAENLERLIKEYGEKKKGSDELFYLTYAMLNNGIKDTISSALQNSNAQDENASYKNIYGKTINQLIDEGKKLMKENNITVEEYKQKLETLDNSINELNQSIDEFNNQNTNQ